MGCDPAGSRSARWWSVRRRSRKRSELQPKRNDTRWLESARIWGGLIGEVSAMKSPMLCDGRRAGGQDRQRNGARHTTAAIAAWLRLPKKEQKETPKPKQLRAMMMNTTVEAAQEILKDSPNGVLL